jgi:hypothetical protein
VKASVKHETVERGATVLRRKGFTYYQVTISVELTHEEHIVMERGGLYYIAICDLPPQVHLVDNDPEEAQSQHKMFPQLTVTMLGAPGHTQTFKRLIDARNFEATVLNGLSRLKNAIERDIANPFQPVRTVEI